MKVNFTQLILISIISQVNAFIPNTIASSSSSTNSNSNSRFHLNNELFKVKAEMMKESFTNFMNMGSNVYFSSTSDGNGNGSPPAYNISFHKDDDDENTFCKLSKVQCYDMQQFWVRELQELENKTHVLNHLYHNVIYFKRYLDTNSDASTMYLSWIPSVKGKKIGPHSITCLKVCGETQRLIVDRIFFHPLYGQFKIPAEPLREILQLSVKDNNFTLDYNNLYSYYKGFHHNWFSGEVDGFYEDIVDDDPE